MAKQTINIGAAANDHTGDTLRTAGDKINDNFTELYNGLIANQFVMTDSVTITNDSTEKTLLGEGKGSLTIPAELLIPGVLIFIRSFGYISTGANDREATLRIKLGGTTLIASVGALPANMNQSAINMQAVIRILDSETVDLSGYTLIQGGSGITTTNMRSLNVTTPVEVDLSEDALLEHTYQFTTATANNSITLTSFEVTLR